MEDIKWPPSIREPSCTSFLGPLNSSCPFCDLIYQYFWLSLLFPTHDTWKICVNHLFPGSVALWWPKRCKNLCLVLNPSVRLRSHIVPIVTTYNENLFRWSLWRFEYRTFLKVSRASFSDGHIMSQVIIQYSASVCRLFWWWEDKTLWRLYLPFIHVWFDFSISLCFQDFDILCSFTTIQRWWQT